MGMSSAAAVAAKLSEEQSKTLAETRVLERQRNELIVLAHSGDEASKKRLAVVRKQIEQNGATLREISQVLEDLQPKVRAEALAKQRTERQAEAARFNCVADAVMTAAQRIDRAVDELAAAMAVAQPLIDEMRRVSVDLTVRRDAQGDIGQMALNRMLALDTSALAPLTELLMIRLSGAGVLHEGAGGYFLDKSQTIEQILHEARRALTYKIKDVLDRDAAEAALLAEPAEAA